MSLSGPVPLSLNDTMVVIETPNEAHGPASELLSGCESVLGTGRCVSTLTTSTSSTDRIYYAQVSWVDPENLTVRIQIFRGRSAESEIFERSVTFLARDTREQRQHAAGVIIAAGVVSTQRSRSADAASIMTQPDQPPQPTPAPAKASPTAAESTISEPPKAPAAARSLGLAWGADAGPLIASGLTIQRPQVGLGLQGWVRDIALPWRAIAAVSFAEGPYEPRLTSWTFDLGMAACIGRLRWLEPRLGLELTQSEVRATTPGGDRVEAAQLIRYGVALGGDFILKLGPSIALLTSVQASAMLPTYDLWVVGKHVGAASLLGWRAFVGLRIGRN